MEVAEEVEAERRTGEVERLASAIYGTVVTASVMVATGGRLSVAETCATVIATVLVYWLAETYARALAHRIHTPAGERPPVNSAAAAVIACGRAGDRGHPGRCEHWRDDSDP